MSGETVERLLTGIRSRFRLTEDCEITMEANPGTAESEIQSLSCRRVNRLSIGVQSFSDEKLRRLGRIHTADDARAAIDMARRSFENFNLDLMYALPGESIADLQMELAEALSSGATHLSCYQLTIEPGTAFEKRLPEDLPDLDETAEMGDVVEAILAQAGYTRYEVSGYAQPGRQCRHNLNYWMFGDYLAAGPGAHGKLSVVNAEGFSILREARRVNPRKWLEALEATGSGAEESHFVPPEDRPLNLCSMPSDCLTACRLRFMQSAQGCRLSPSCRSSNACAVTVCFRRIPTALRRRAGAWISCRMFRKLFYKQPALSSSWPCTTLAQF